MPLKAVLIQLNLQENVPSDRSGPSSCPRIQTVGKDDNEILVPFGTKKRVHFRAQIIGQFIVQSRFVCQFNIEGHVTSVSAQLLGDAVYCDSVEFVYASNSPNVTVPLAVIWGGTKPLDNPDNIHGENINIQKI